MTKPLLQRRFLRNSVWVLLTVIVAAITARKAAQWRSDWRIRTEETRNAAAEAAFRKKTAPAEGRAEFVSSAALMSDPAKYDGQRVILSGIWIVGFETSNLEIQNKNQNPDIWVEADWNKIDEPMGDFSRRKEMENPLKLDQNGFMSFQIVAEGTFHYRRRDAAQPLSGFGHMGVAEGFFLIDRLFEWNVYQKDAPNQAREATATAVMPAAEQPPRQP